MGNPATEGLVVCAPVFNEAALVDELLRRFVAVAESVRLVGVVVVDDGSTDGTAEVVRRCGARSMDGVRVRLVRLTRNFGHQQAMLAGLGAAIEWADREAIPLIGMMDGDLQDRPEHLGPLVAGVADADVAYAVREVRHEAWLFRAFAGAFHWFLARHGRFAIPRDAGMFCVMRRRVARALVDNADRNPYLPGLRAWVGFRQVGVPLERDARAGGRSRVGPLGLVRLAVNALLGYSDAPQVLVAALGLVTLAISALAGATMATLKLLGLLEVQGTALIITSIFFALGVQTVATMLLAQMIARATTESSRKPSFLVLTDEELP